jgi:hypothetical protein
MKLVFLLNSFSKRVVNVVEDRIGPGSSKVSAMDAPIDLMKPRIKEDGVTVWYGQTAYRNCHLKAVAEDERTITLSNEPGPS